MPSCSSCRVGGTHCIRLPGPAQTAECARVQPPHLPERNLQTFHRHGDSEGEVGPQRWKCIRKGKVVTVWVEFKSSTTWVVEVAVVGCGHWHWEPRGAQWGWTSPPKPGRCDEGVRLSQREWGRRSAHSWPVKLEVQQTDLETSVIVCQSTEKMLDTCCKLYDKKRRAILMIFFTKKLNTWIFSVSNVL